MKNRWFIMSDKELDSFIRKGLKRHITPFDETSWVNMKIKLNSYSYIQQQQTI